MYSCKKVLVVFLKSYIGHANCNAISSDAETVRELVPYVNRCTDTDQAEEFLCIGIMHTNTAIGNHLA
ncbi:MAG: hypothetical protein K0Q75_896, partial [Anaerospora sp.]|nr:hypothetical protein [Anaerospora sp.]